MDNIWFTCLTLNTNQIHFNTPYAERTQFGKPLVNSAFTLALVTGMTVPDTSENAAANLAWTDIKLPKPVFAGDTLWAESEILDLRESKSNPSVGIVSMRCRGINQRREVVIEFKRTFMVYKREAPEARVRVPRHRHGLERRMTAAQTIAEWATTLTPDDIPEDVAEHAKLHFLDALGCGYAASALEVAAEGRTAMAELGGEPQASVIGLDGALPAPNAAFANGMLCHGLDFDDTHSDSVSHVSVVVCPAALATAEAQGSSGAELLTAIVAGNEVVTRVGMAASGLFHARGFHPTAICGIFGGTAAAARLLGADAAANAPRALGIAGSFAGGLFAYLDDATATKPFHPAWAAHGSILAARLAQLGGEGPPGVLEGRFGLYHAFLGGGAGRDPDRRAARRPRLALGDAAHRVQAVPGLPLHPRLARRDRGPRPARPGRDRGRRRHRAGGGRVARARARRRGRSRRARSTRRSSASSTRPRRCSSTAPPGSRPTPTRRSPTRRVLDLARRVRYETKEYETYPAAFPGGVRITMRDGSVLEAELPYQRGGPENPLSTDEVRAKFRENAALALPPSRRSSRWRARSSRSRQLDDVTRAPPRSRVVARERGDRRGRPRVGRARGLPGRVRATSTRTSSRSRSSSR